MKNNRRLSGCFLIAVLCAGGVWAGSIIKVPSPAAKTITTALITARPGDTVLVADGTYRENIIIATGVCLKAQNNLWSIINGRGRGIAVTMGKGSTISGFIVTNGTIGVFSSGKDNSILGCSIERNWLTGLIAVRHLPKIEDNMIVFNRASGIQLWDCRQTVSTINHNTIAYNSNHGIAIGGSSELTIENNIIAHNERLGLKIIGPGDKILVRNNSFYANLPGAPAVPGQNLSIDPQFYAPWSMTFSLKAGSGCIARGLDAKNLGARNVF
ncbi:MAG: right-handed parallel beta-helix repeat-containing protein [Chitinivibrionales bacterium]|nr:right-handed parallel beta-helix repeat-containing protein [Chitinivibrionales bacterium]